MLSVSAAYSLLVMPRANSDGSNPGRLGEGKYVPVLGIKRDDRAAALAESLLRHLLDLQVERQHEIISGGRRRGCADQASRRLTLHRAAERNWTRISR